VTEFAAPHASLIDDAQDALERKTRQQEQLIQTARYLTASLDVKEVLTRIGLGAKEILRAYGCSIYLLEPDGLTLDPVVAFEPGYAREILSTPLSVEDSFTGQAVKQERALIFNDAAMNADGYQIPGTPIEEYERIIVTPLLADGKVLGGMCLSRMGTLFSEEDLALAETFATYAATALKNAQMYRDLQHEVEERKRAEDALREGEARYRTTIDAMGDIVHVVDRDLRLTLFNEALLHFAQGIGFAGEIVGASLFELFPFLPPEIADEYGQVMAKAQTLVTEEMVRVGQESAWAEVHKIPIRDQDGQVYRVITIIHDISERKRAERQRRQLEENLERASRLESLGVLAGGVAHDLNNLLGPLVAYPELILADLPDDSPIREDVTQIKHAAERATAVVQDLLALARRDTYRMSPTSMNEIVQQVVLSLPFVELKSRNPSVHVHVALAPELLNISGSAAHLSKVLMNLAVNAYEAMPAGGDLSISTSCESLDRLVRGYEDIPAGDYVVLRVADTGTGIEQRDVERLFEPFYTKKEMGRGGSGLGLAVVYGVVHDHRGKLDLKTEVGKGTELALYLPATYDALPADAQEKGDYRGNERVLVIDDLEEQRALAVRLLSSLGYQVNAVESGHAAIAYLQQHEADILLLDMVMEEGFDGLDTYREIARLGSTDATVPPEQGASKPLAIPRVVMASGFSETERIREAQEMGIRQVVRKPYTLSGLGRAIRSELDQGTGT